METDGFREYQELAICVLEKAMQGILIADLDGNLRYVNNAFCSMWGYEKDEILGSHVSRFWKNKKAFGEAYEAVLFYGNWTGELLAEKNDNSSFSVLFSIFLLSDTNDKTVGIAASCIDISQQKMFEERMAVLAHIIEQSNSIVAITDTDGKIEYVNPMFADSTGYSQAEVIGKKLSILKSGYTSSSEYRKIWENLHSGGSWRGELLNRRKDGHLFWENASISAIKDKEGRVIYFSKVSNDVTREKDLEHLKDKVEDIITHDIRNPITSILAVPKLLLGDENLSENQREYLEIIEQAGHSILNLTSSLREMKMIENKAITQHCKEVDIIRIIKQLIKERCCKYDIPSEKIKVSSNRSSDADTESFIVRGDEAFLYSVLSNLLENAIEASAGKSPVSIDLSNSGNEKMICIHNNEEVPEEVRESFFEKYSSCGKSKGSGIGTYSSKIMVEAMGGRICMRTSKKDGTRLCIYLPD